MRQFARVQALRAVLLGMMLASAAADGARANSPIASIVVDARDGTVLEATNADRRQHPASLTKMITLYMTFEAIRDGRLGLDQRVPVSAHAARQPPSKMGLRAGQRVAVRDLIRAAAVRSANDAAVVLAEAIGGTEARFAEMATRRARELGMGATTFRNASGLTATGHLSTARDMAVLGRRLQFDFPQYFNVFGRQHTEAMGRRINNTNRLLGNYAGANGIKTGYTRAAGYNLVASAERGSRQVIAVLMGGRTAAARDAAVRALLDEGMSEAPVRVALVPPAAAPLGAPASAADRAEATLRAPMPVPRAGTAEPAVDMVATIIESLDESAMAAPVAEPEADEGEGAESGAEQLILRRTPPPAPGRPALDPRGWTVDLGRFSARAEAEASLHGGALSEVPGLDGAMRQISASADTPPTFAARLTGLDGLTALTACAVLGAHGRSCTPVPPAIR